MKRIQVVVALTVVAIVSISQCQRVWADECGENSSLIKDRREGRHDAGEVKFTYESLVGKYSTSTYTYLWCITADKQNQNIAEFKWGDNGKYLHTLIEPGATAINSIADGTQPMAGSRRITFRRKNKSDWDSIDTDTISSRRFGDLKIHPEIILVQSNGSSGSISSALEAYRNEDGLIQVDRLSSNKSLFMRFLDQQDKVSVGSSFTVTLPTSSKVADLLERNQYEIYDRADFVRARADFLSTLSYNKGDPLIYYAFRLNSETIDQKSKLERVLQSSPVYFFISPGAESKGSDPIFNLGPINIRNLDGSYQTIGEVTLGGRPITIGTALVAIAPYKVAIASATAPLFFPK